MLPEIEKLLVLQDRDQRIAHLKAELKSVPVEHKALEARLAALAGEADKARTGVRTLEVEKKRLETEAAGKREQIARFKTQQMQTRKNEEFQAFGVQIKHFEGEISKLEDRELEIMEAMEAAKPALAQADRAAAEAKERVAEQMANLEAKTKALDEQLKAAEAARGQYTEGLSEDVLYEYNSLFKTKNGLAVVALEHEVCTGCHMKVTTQTVVNAKSAPRITNCEQCGRIVYWQA
jgi:uncharacterized protein